MDPEKFKLCAYEQIPLVTEADFQQLAKTKHVVLYYNLIVDYEGFNHPGYFNSIHQFKGKQISEVYAQKEHSFNADLILCHKVIGRLQNSALEAQCHSFYHEIKESQLNVKHQQVLSKFDFTKPLLQTIKTLTMGELYTLTEIPKDFKDPYAVKVANSSNKSRWEVWLSKKHIWFYTGVFLLQMVGVLAFLSYNYSCTEVLLKSYFIILGYIVWSLLEYLIHRFDFHHNMYATHLFKGGDMHHCFPNLPESVPISAGSVNFKLTILVAVLYFIIEPMKIALLLVGILCGLLFYNIIHYNWHLGPEVNIGWLRALRTHHLNHHFKDQHSMFGITCTLWDHLYNTMQPRLKSK